MKKKTHAKKTQKSAALLFVTFFVLLAILVGGVALYTGLRYPVKYQNYIAKYSDEYSLSRTLVASLINEESSFKNDAISAKGAMGLMQITPQTGKFVATQLGEDYVPENLLNPETNIKYGCFYLNYLRKKFVDEEVFLSAYNAGESTVNLWLKNKSLSNDGVTLSKIPYPVTRAYTQKILDGKKHYQKRV